jgi:hypothetical protein
MTQFKSYKCCKECQQVIHYNGVEITADDRRTLNKHLEGIYHQHCFCEKLVGFAKKRRLQLI